MVNFGQIGHVHVFYKIVRGSDSEVYHTKFKPNSVALHTYVDFVSKRVGAPAPRIRGNRVNFMYYIEKSPFFQVLTSKLRTFFSFILI